MCLFGFVSVLEFTFACLHFFQGSIGPIGAPGPAGPQGAKVGLVHNMSNLKLFKFYIPKDLVNM